MFYPFSQNKVVSYHQYPKLLPGHNNARGRGRLSEKSF